MRYRPIVAAAPGVLVHRLLRQPSHAAVVMLPRGAVVNLAQTDLKFRSSLSLAEVKSGWAASLSLSLQLSSQKDQLLVNLT